MPMIHRPALLLVGLQVGYDAPGFGRRGNPGLEAVLAAVLTGWRERGHPVIHVRHVPRSPTSPLWPGAGGSDWKAQVAPRSGEPVIETSTQGAFIGTSLEADLRERYVDTVVIGGLTTNHAVSSTARNAADLGFATVVLSDGSAAFERRGGDSAEVVHAMALADLRDGIAKVSDSRTVLADLARGIRSVEAGLRLRWEPI